MDTDDEVEEDSEIGMVDTGGSEETLDGSSEKHVSRSDDVQKRLDSKTDLTTATGTGLQGAGNGERDYAQIDDRIRDLQTWTCIREP